MKSFTSLCAAAVTAAVTTSLASAQTTECMNLRPDGLALQASLDAKSCSISADGQIVAFTTLSNVLVPGAPSHQLVYVRNRTTNALTIASKNSSGFSATSAAGDGWVSADGRFVAFSSSANNLVAADTNGTADAFVHDLQTGITTRVSLDAAGNQVVASSVATSISADGRFVAFETNGAFVPGDTNARLDIYVRDVLLGTTRRASVTTLGAQSTGDCRRGSLSADGNRCTFDAYADDLEPGDTNGFVDVVMRDEALGTTVLVSRTAVGAPANGHCSFGRISGNGLFVAFISLATNLDPTVAVTGGQAHVFVRDLAAGTTTLLDKNAAGIAGNLSGFESLPPRLSHDGRFVVFVSASNNLVPADVNGTSDVFKVDRVAGTIERASVGACGQEQVLDVPNGSISPGVSDDGQCVVFAAAGENLVAGDSSGAEALDVLVRDATKPAIGSIVCAGPNSAPCPCGLPALVNRGCRNSNEATGLFASGTARVSADTLRFGAFELPHGTFTCVLFQGTQTLGGGAGTPFGQGVVCVGGQLVRIATKTNDYVEGLYYPALGNVRVSIAGGVPVAGATRYYQLWFPDAISTCTAAHFNFSNAVEVVWLP